MADAAALRTVPDILLQLPGLQGRNQSLTDGPDGIPDLESMHFFCSHTAAIIRTMHTMVG